jgi:hypothetical protein
VKIAGGVLILAMMAPVSCNAVTAKRPTSHITTAIAGAFRADAEAAYRLIEPVCGTTLNPELLRRYEPFRARLAALDQRAAGTPFQAILAGARKRQETLASEVDCARPEDDAGTAGRVTRDLAAAARALSRMERVISSYTPKKG